MDLLKKAFYGNLRFTSKIQVYLFMDFYAMLNTACYSESKNDSMINSILNLGCTNYTWNEKINSNILIKT